MNWYKKAQQTKQVDDISSIQIIDEVSDFMSLKEFMYQGRIQDGYYIIGDEVFHVQNPNISLVNNLKANFNYDSGDHEVSQKEATEIAPDNILAQIKNTKIVDSNGYPILMHHGTGESFDQFNFDRSGQNFPGIGNVVDGIYFSPKQKEAEEYGELSGAAPVVVSAWLNIENPIYKNQINGISDEMKEGESITDTIKRLGYDGYILTSRFGQIEEAAVFDNSQIFRKI